MQHQKLGEILIQAGILSPSQVHAALEEQRRWGGALGRVLIASNAVDETTLVTALSKQLGIPSVDLDHWDVPDSISALVDGAFAARHMLVPFNHEDGMLEVAMEDPRNRGVIDEMRLRTQHEIRPYVAGPYALERAIAVLYGTGAGSLDLTLGTAGSAGRPPTGEPRRRQPTAPGGMVADVPPAELTEVDGVDVDSQLRALRAEVAALQRRITLTESLLNRDEDVLRRLMLFLVDKGLASRQEILERLNLT